MSDNRITGLLALVIGGIYLFSALNLHRLAMGDPLGPRVFPVGVALLLIFFGLLLLIKDIRTAKEQRKAVSFNMTPEGKRVLLRIAVTAVLGILYGYLLDPLGYVISTIFFMLGLMFSVNTVKRWKENILISLGFSIITYVGFATLLHLSLPRGILSF